LRYFFSSAGLTMLATCHQSRQPKVTSKKAKNQTAMWVSKRENDLHLLGSIKVEIVDSRDVDNSKYRL
jgi:uncharacterized protein YbaP (TraB family)